MTDRILERVRELLLADLERPEFGEGLAECAWCCGWDASARQLVPPVRHLMTGGLSHVLVPHNAVPPGHVLVHSHPNTAANARPLPSPPDSKAASVHWSEGKIGVAIVNCDASKAILLCEPPPPNEGAAT